MTLLILFLIILILFLPEPCFGVGLALRWFKEPEQEAVQGRDVSAAGSGAAATEAGKREASDGGGQHQRRPRVLQRKG